MFTFATRLTRLTGTLAHTRPGVASRKRARRRRTGWAAPGSGSQLAEFNDSHGRPGMARGAVVVIISDGWDTGTRRSSGGKWSGCPGSRTALSGSTRGPEPRVPATAGGMAAAWPFCDAVVSAHSLNALDDLTAALAHSAARRLDPPHAAPSPAAKRAVRLGRRQGLLVTGSTSVHSK